MKGSTSSSPGHAITRTEIPHDDVCCGYSLTECCNIFPNRFPYQPTVMLQLPLQNQRWQNQVNNSYACVTLAWSVSYSNEYGDNSHDLFQDRRDDEPQITEEAFFSKMLTIRRVNSEVLVPKLEEHGILLDESIMPSLMYHMGRIDEFHYVMYRLGKKENGLQIFYRCLRETQDELHRWVADWIERKGISYCKYYHLSIIMCVSENSITGLHSGSTHREFNNYGCSSYHLHVFLSLYRPLWCT